MITTSYGFAIEPSVINSDINRLTNQLWKLIPMRENDENWVLQLNTVIIELYGLHTILSTKNNFLILLSKLEGIKNIDTDFYLYRKTIFESISLLREMKYSD